MYYLRFFFEFSTKWANHSFLLIFSFLVSDVSESLISLKSNEQCERIAHFAHQKWTTMSDLLRSLRGNERCEQIRSPKMSKWVNRSFFWANRSFAHFWTKNKQFAWKSNERISSPDSNTPYCDEKDAIIFAPTVGGERGNDVRGKGKWCDGRGEK